MVSSTPKLLDYVPCRSYEGDSLTLISKWTIRNTLVSTFGTTNRIFSNTIDNKHGGQMCNWLLTKNRCFTTATFPTNTCLRAWPDKYGGQPICSTTRWHPTRKYNLCPFSLLQRPDFCTNRHVSFSNEHDLRPNSHLVRSKGAKRVCSPLDPSGSLECSHPLRNPIEYWIGRKRATKGLYHFRLNPYSLL